MVDRTADERSSSRWDLERQVRLVAGSMVLAGLLGGRRWRPASLLAVGAGTGLTVTALADTCTMGEVLARLPFNRHARSLTPRITARYAGLGNGETTG